MLVTKHDDKNNECRDFIDSGVCDVLAVVASSYAGELKHYDNADVVDDDCENVQCLRK